VFNHAALDATVEPEHDLLSDVSGNLIRITTFAITNKVIDVAAEVLDSPASTTQPHNTFSLTGLGP
jgi:hypothetical protein